MTVLLLRQPQNTALNKVSFVGTNFFSKRNSSVSISENPWLKYRRDIVFLRA